MNKKPLFVKIWPLVLLTIFWGFFSLPYFFNGAIPFPGDNQQYAFSPWDAYITKGPIKNPAMTDVIVQIYPWRRYTIDSLKHAVIPLWNPYSFAGTAHVGNYQSSVFSPLSILFFMLPFNSAWGLFILLQPLLAGVFMYLFLRCLKISQVGSLIGSLGFMFCGFMTVWMAWGTLDYAVLTLPLSLFGVEKFFQKGKSRYSLIVFLTIPFSFLSGHFQTSLYFLLFLLAFVCYKWFTVKKSEKGFFLIANIVLGLLIAAPQILPSIGLYAQSLRATLFEKGEVIPWGYIVTFVAPDFFGNPVTRNDWFGHYAEWNGYIGLFPLMLSWYALLRKRSTTTLFFAVTGFISLLLAFSSPLLDLITFLHIPVLSTSAASRIIVITSFSLLVLAGFGFDAFYADIERKKIKPIALWISLFGLVFLTGWITIRLKIILPERALGIAKQNLVLPTILFVSILLSIGFSYILQNKRIVSHAVAGAFILIVMVDMFRFSNKWIPFVNQKKIFSKTPITVSFRPHYSYERVLGNYGAEMAMTAHYPSVDGYDAVYERRYGEFIHFVNTGTIGESEKSLVVIAKNSPLTWPAINLMNVSYIIHKLSDGHADWTFHFWDYQKQMQLVYKDDDFEVYKNIASFPHAFLAGKYTVRHTPYEILSTMFSPRTDLHHELVLEEDPKMTQFSDDPGVANIISYKQNDVTISTSAKHSVLLFLPDNFAPEWQATVDGSQTKIYRADYTFKSIVVPAGNHIATFRYEPKSFRLGFFGTFFGIVGGVIIMPLMGKGKKRMPVV